MERFYIRIWYLKGLHYFFFSFAVLSITAGMIFFNFALLESLNFLFLGSFYCFYCLVTAYYFYKDYRETIEPFRVIKLYLFPYIILDMWTIGSMVFLIWVFPSFFALLYSFLFIDYYIFFLLLIGLVVSRFRVVSKFFEVYNIFILRRAMGVAKEHARFVDISMYSVGSVPEMDEILDDIWIHKDYPLPHVRKFEIAVCDKRILDITRILNRLRRRPSESERKVIKSLEKQKDDYLEKIREIEEKVD